jgi:hypothetical protein
MFRVRTFFLASATIILGACSDTQPTTGPTDTGPDLREQGVTKELRGFWTQARGRAEAEQGGALLMHSPLLCNFGGTGPECMRVFHDGRFVQEVFHKGTAQGTGCSRSIIRIAGIIRGRSGFRCHRRGDVLRFTWIVREFHPFGTRIQVDYTGAGAASPTGFVFTNYR